MIQNVQYPTGAFPVSNLLNARYSGRNDAISVAVNSNLYFRLEHVMGIPSSKDGEGVSISKLQVLDNLIERLSKLKGEKIPNIKKEQLDSQELNVLIDKYKQELHQEIAKSRQTPYGFSYGQGIVENGYILNIVA